MKEDYTKELNGLRKYLKNPSNEDAKRPLIYPLFKKLFTNDFKIESDAAGADTYIEGKLVVELKTKKNQ